MQRPEIDTTSHFLPLFIPSNEHYHKRFLTFYGGRGGMKSWQIARGCLVRASANPITVLCTREFQNSMDDSVMAVLEEQAKALDVMKYFNFQKSNIYGIGNKNRGCKFSFKGLARNINSIKSFEGADLVWNEEAQETSQRSIDKLYPTIRKKGAQIITSFNPDKTEDPIYVRHVLQHDENEQYLCLVNYTDNPWIDEAFVKEAERLRRVDPEAYDHIYKGMCWIRSDAQILNGKWVVEEFEAESYFDGPYYGADWGFANDPLAFVKCWIGPHALWGDNCLYIEYEETGIGVELDDIATLFKKVSGAKRHTIRADNSRPETISHVSNKGNLNVVAADKWGGSVEDGIEFLRSFDKIIIHKRCKMTQLEAKLYCYKQDRLTEDVLPVIIDKHNHCMDAIRYALQPLIKKRVIGLTQEQIRQNTRATKTTTAPSEGAQEW